MTKFVGKHVSVKQHQRIEECCTWIEFLADKEETKMKWYQASSCKFRFCPMCAYRKTFRDSLMISVMMDYIADVHKKSFIFVTLTAPNVKADKLSEEISNYNKAFKRLLLRKEIVPINQGFVRKLEITYNAQRDDYHPHYHCIFAVDPGYFAGHSYLKQDKWLSLWREVMRDDIITQVDVRCVKKSNCRSNKAVNEIAKYAAKDADYLRSQEIFDVFYNALNRRQILTFGGLFKDAVKLYKDGKLDDYKESDMNEYHWLIMQYWTSNEYEEQRRRELTATEKELAAMGKRFDDLQALEDIVIR